MAVRLILFRFCLYVLNRIYALMLRSLCYFINNLHALYLCTEFVYINGHGALCCCFFSHTSTQKYQLDTQNMLSAENYHFKVVLSHAFTVHMQQHYTGFFYLLFKLNYFLSSLQQQQKKRRRKKNYESVSEMYIFYFIISHSFFLLEKCQRSVHTHSLAQNLCSCMI